MLKLLAYQLDVSIEALKLKAYGEREQTGSNHLLQIMPRLGYHRAVPFDLAKLEAWLVGRALEHDRPTFLLHAAIERLRWDRILRPGLTSLERIVSTARQRARQVTFDRVSHLLTPQGRRSFEAKPKQLPDDA